MTWCGWAIALLAVLFGIPLGFGVLGLSRWAVVDHAGHHLTTAREPGVQR